MTLAIFDLDNTLIAGDSDYLWGQYLVSAGAVDPERFTREHDRFYQEYLDGSLDIQEFLRFQLAPLAENDPERLEEWRQDFIESRIKPILLPRAVELVEEHRTMGRTLLIVTATNRFITEPIARLFGIAHLIATEPEVRDGRYTGQVSGVPSYAEGKVERLNEWIANHGETLAGSWFYSDSHNDLPLLERVEHPIAVDPDPVLDREAENRAWPVISLRKDPPGTAGTADS